MTRRLWWVAPGALVLAWLLTLAPASAPVADLLFDAQLLLAWPDTPRSDVAVVEIDDASVRALQTQLGPWPYPPATHAALAEFLLELGAKAVVFDVPLADAPDGNGVLARTLAQRARGAGRARLAGGGRLHRQRDPRRAAAAWACPAGSLAAHRVAGAECTGCDVGCSAVVGARRGGRPLMATVTSHAGR